MGSVEAHVFNILERFGANRLEELNNYSGEVDKTPRGASDRNSAKRWWRPSRNGTGAARHQGPARRMIEPGHDQDGSQPERHAART